MLPWLMLLRRNGIKVRAARLADDPAVILQNFDEQITPRTRLVFASHVSCISGLRLPVCEISQLAHDRGVLAAVDGSHALGQFPINAKEIGCDAYIGCGHKWLLGPQGTSFTYVVQEHLQTFQPSWIGWGAQQELSIDLQAGSFRLHPTGRQYEYGTKQWMLFPGLARAIRFINEVGLEAIQAQVEPLATQLKTCIDEVPHWQRLTTLRPEMSAGLVSLQFKNGVRPDAKEWLWERHRLLVAFDAAHSWMRLSVAFFTTEAEIEQAVDAILALSKDGG
jgi:selenocysteine lyase/cysteine desulfurase